MSNSEIQVTLRFRDHHTTNLFMVEVIIIFFLSVSSSPVFQWNFQSEGIRIYVSLLVPSFLSHVVNSSILDPSSTMFSSLGSTCTSKIYSFASSIMTSFSTTCIFCNWDWVSMLHLLLISSMTSYMSLSFPTVTVNVLTLLIQTCSLFKYGFFTSLRICLCHFPRDTVLQLQVLHKKGTWSVGASFTIKWEMQCFLFPRKGYLEHWNTIVLFCKE